MWNPATLLAINTLTPCWLCSQIDGDWRVDMRRGCLVWSIEHIDATNRTGSAEFVVPAAQPDAFFPIEVRHQQRD